MVNYLFAKLLKRIHIPALYSSAIHKSSYVGSFSNIINTTIDRFSYAGDCCTISNTTIGSFCSIAANCIIGGASHPVDWVSSSSVFHNGRNILGKNFSNHDYNMSKRTSIGNDVWLGNNVLVKAGISIGNGAVIGMGSIVTKNVPPYEIWAGNPAKMIKKRFSDFIIEDLISINWYEWDEKKIIKYAFYFNDVESFIEKVKDNY